MAPLWVGVLVCLQAPLAFAELLQISSTYEIDRPSKKKTALIQGTGTPIEFEGHNPVTGKKERLVAVFVSRHVSGGIAASLQIKDGRGRSIAPLQRCANTAGDLELIVVPAEGIKPLAQYDPASSEFTLKPDALDDWHVDVSAGSISGQGRKLWSRLSRAGKTIRTNVPKATGEEATLEKASRPSFALVPKWVAYKPERAEAPEIALSSASDDVVKPSQLEATSYGNEHVSSAKVAPGMSGSPLIEITGQKGSRLQGRIIGITSRVMRDFNRSYFVTSQLMLDLLNQQRNGRCSGGDGGSWRYRMTEQGEGLLYRVIKTRFGEIKEISPLAARAGTVLSLPVGNGSDTPGGNGSDTPGGNGSDTPGGNGSDTPGGNGSDTPGGNGSDTPGGNGSDTPGGNGSDTPGGTEFKPGYNPETIRVKVDTRHNHWERLNIAPGLEVSGKPALAIRAKRQNGKEALLFADLHAIDFLQKNESVQAEFLKGDEFSFTELLRRKAGIHDPCFQLAAGNSRSAKTTIEVHDRQIKVRIATSTPRFDGELTRDIEDVIEFTLDDRGVLKGSGNRFFVPVIHVTGQPLRGSGTLASIEAYLRGRRDYAIDLTRLFFNDVSQLYGTKDVFQEDRQGPKLLFRHEEDRFERSLSLIQSRSIPCAPEKTCADGSHAAPSVPGFSREAR